MKRFHQGHVYGAGCLTGLMVTYRPLYIFAAGIFCGLLLAGGIRLGRVLLQAFEEWRKQSRAKRGPRPGPRAGEAVRSGGRGGAVLMPSWDDARTTRRRWAQAGAKLEKARQLTAIEGGGLRRRVPSWRLIAGLYLWGALVGGLVARFVIP